jgi:hypothetical protein
MTTKTRLAYLFLAFILLAPAFLTPAAPVHAEGWGDYSADVDGDGLSNAVEQAGWYNDEGGPYFTNYLDADTDNDGLTDGEEKLYDTDPFQDHSPGLYVKYQEDFQTREYFVWQRFGNQYIALPYPSTKDAVIVRRGTTFSVGGPADATIEIEKSLTGLTTLTAEWDYCAGQWKVYIPSWGTVGKYTITVTDGTWEESMYLYVIFDLPTGSSDDFITGTRLTTYPGPRARWYTASGTQARRASTPTLTAARSQRRAGSQMANGSTMATPTHLPPRCMTGGCLRITS